MLLDYVSTQKKSKKLVGVTNRMKSLNDGTRNIHYKWLRVMNGLDVVVHGKMKSLNLMREMYS